MSPDVDGFDCDENPDNSGKSLGRDRIAERDSHPEFNHEDHYVSCRDYHANESEKQERPLACPVMGAEGCFVRLDYVQGFPSLQAVNMSVKSSTTLETERIIAVSSIILTALYTI